MTQHNIDPAAGAEHAFLSASGSDRWMNCTPSARFEMNYPDSESVHALEGSLGHALTELRVLEHLGRITLGTRLLREQEVLKGPEFRDAEGESLWSPDLEYAVKQCVDVAVERITMARAVDPGAVVMVEQKLDFSRWVPFGWGTGDLTIAANGVLDVTDYKFGKGVAVEAVDNSQLKLYGLGAYATFGMLGSFSHVNVNVMQPRLGGFKSVLVPVAELVHWAENEVKPRAKLAFAGEGEYKVGDWCRFCRGRAQCKARADYMLGLEPMTKRHPNEMTPEEIATALQKSEGLVSWAENVKEYALEQVTGPGRVKLPGFKVVEGRADRYYKNPLLIAEAARKAGFEDAVLYKAPQLVGLTDMERVVGGKKAFEKLFGKPEAEGSLIGKPKGKPTLVPVTDERPEMSLDNAATDFAHLIPKGN